jgi:hypothetical protein
MRNLTFNSKLTYARVQQDRANWRRQLETETNPQVRAELHAKLTGNTEWKA